MRGPDSDVKIDLWTGGTAVNSNIRWQIIIPFSVGPSNDNNTCLQKLLLIFPQLPPADKYIFTSESGFPFQFTKNDWV